MEETATNVMSPMIQYGFAGFCLILIGVIIWLIRELLSVLKENNKVIALNTQTIEKVVKATSDTFGIMVGIKDNLLKRPCIAKFKQAETEE